MVLLSRKEKRSIMQYLFKEGVMVVEKNPRKEKHDELVEISNLKCYMLCRSLESRGYLMSKFNWQWHYYFLLDEGIEYLREVLGLPATAQPDTWTKPRPTRMTGGSEGRKGGGKGKGKGWRGDGEERPAGGYGRGKAVMPEVEFKPENPGGAAAEVEFKPENPG